jgi:hypothetical protein
MFRSDHRWTTDRVRRTAPGLFHTAVRTALPLAERQRIAGEHAAADIVMANGLVLSLRRPA